MKILLHCMVLVLMFFSLNVFSQQVSDDDFLFKDLIPAFDDKDGPVVCIDEAHNNFHTADGRYKPFANLLRQDGFRVSKNTEKITVDSLSQCDVLVIANAISSANDKDWKYPHYSAFTGDEINYLIRWIREGGSLLLFADHAPFAGAASDLGLVMGLIMTDVYAVNKPLTKENESFNKEQRTLHDHSITRGRNVNEAVDEVITFTGQPAQLSQYWKPLITFSDSALAFVNAAQTNQKLGKDDRPPMFSIAGWSHAATREWDEGRIVFVGEAALCSAQLSGPDKMPMGMNSPVAKQNPLFCLNMVRWLTRVLK